MKLTQISVIKKLMTENETVFKKKFGQNFLISDTVPQQIAESVPREFGKKLNIIEIGPGIGTLTAELCRVADKVCAIEIDRDLIPILDKTLSEFDNVSVINEDIMKCNLSEICNSEFGSQDFSVCANLPYYITTPIIMSLLENAVKPKSIIIMVQKEVADRLTANPGTSQYGAISASIAWYGIAERLFCVPSGCFMPRPKIDSAVIRITLHNNPPADIVSEEKLKRVIRGAFAQRRKTLINSIGCEFGEYSKEQLAKVIESCDIRTDIRGECLGISEFAKLANKL